MLLIQLNLLALQEKFEYIIYSKLIGYFENVFI